MAQFTVYSSSDGGAPTLDGTAGSLIGVLDACLVDGFGAKAAAGWSHPVPTASNIASYQMGSGTGFGFVLNDNGPNGTSTYKEAWAIGWESIAGVGAPVGSGSGQFPLPAQLLTTGHGVVRKSATADATARDWIVFADDKTVYVFIHTGDNVAYYYAFFFGDYFSLGGASDAYRCFIWVGINENTSTAANYNQDKMSAASYTTAVGLYIARAYGGAGSSIQAQCLGDVGKATGTTAQAMGGLIQTPNGPDTGYEVSPLWLMETTGNPLRGRLRGLYHLCHPYGSFSDGQVFGGANDYLGKDFLIVHRGPANGFWVLETSNTLDTNA